MLRAPEQIWIVAGSAEDTLIPLFDDDGDKLLSLDGWTGLLQVRYERDPAAELLTQWSTDDATMVLAESSARLVMTAAKTAESLAWTWRAGWFDLKLTSPAQQGSLPNRPIRGLMRVQPGIST